MRKIFEHHESTKVGHYASILEAAGFATMIKNEFAEGAELTPLSQPPQLWVMEDTDYDQALEILRQFEEGASS